MKRSSSVLLLLAVALSSGCKTLQYGASWQDLPRKQVQERLLAGNYQLYTSVAQMPAGLKDAFRRSTRQLSFDLVDPTATATDFQRKLLFWGSSPSNSFVHYRYGPGTIILIFKPAQRRYEFVWGARAATSAPEFANLKHMVSAGEFKDDQPYWW